MIVCFLLVAAEINWLELGSYRVSSSGEAFEVLHVDNPLEPIRKPGRMLTASGAGVLFNRDGQTLFYAFNNGKEIGLPKPDGVILAAPLPDMFLPAFFTAEALVFFYEGSWQRVSAPAWCELTPPKTAMGSRIGLNLLVPSVIQLDTALYIYQGKTGKLILVDPSTGQRSEKMLSKKLVPIKLADDLIWLNAPKKGRLALSKAGTFVHHISVPDLSRHSPAWPVADGCWLFSFADGFSDALNSWDSGMVPVRAHFIRVTGSKLNKRSFPSSPLPVRFQMETSASGSPRLEIEPLFKVLPVHADNRLVVLYKTSYFVLDPDQGVGRHIKLESLETPPVAVIRNETGLTMLLADGKRLPLEM